MCYRAATALPRFSCFFVQGTPPPYSVGVFPQTVSILLVGCSACFVFDRPYRLIYKYCQRCFTYLVMLTVCARRGGFARGFYFDCCWDDEDHGSGADPWNLAVVSHRPVITRVTFIFSIVLYWWQHQFYNSSHSLQGRPQFKRRAWRHRHYEYHVLLTYGQCTCTYLIRGEVNVAYACFSSVEEFHC